VLLHTFILLSVTYKVTYAHRNLSEMKISIHGMRVGAITFMFEHPSILPIMSSLFLSLIAPPNSILKIM
jgi:hypothetical protein